MIRYLLFVNKGILAAAAIVAVGILLVILVLAQNFLSPYYRAVTDPWDPPIAKAPPPRRSSG